MPQNLGRPNVRIVTLGCAKNDVDSEEIAGVLAEAGYEVDGSAKKADVVVINTCGFLQAAKEESIQAIKDAVREKKAGRVKLVVVAGCLAQRTGAELARLAPGADTYVGVGQMGRFGEIVGGLQLRQATVKTGCGMSNVECGPESVRTSGIPHSTFHIQNPESAFRDPQSKIRNPKSLVDISPPHHRWADVATRARTGNPWSAYLKVSEGCDHKCTFCTIPSFRGPHQSKPVERLIEEARHLAGTGAKEINLIAQDVTQYGYDIYKEFTLPRLLRELNDVVGIEWIRLLYFYPNRLTDEVVEAMATLPKVLPYIDIPLQHAHPDALRRMKRPWEGERYLRIFEKLRAAMPDCAIRTTFIVGFPGETDKEFSYLLEFMQEARLDRVGAFMYSREPGTPSHDMDGQVPSRIKRLRFDALMRLQQGISRQVNEGWVGRRMRVLVEREGSSSVGLSGGWDLNTRNSKSAIPNPKPHQPSTLPPPPSLWRARSHRDAPEIDGLVYVTGVEDRGSRVGRPEPQPPRSVGPSQSANSTLNPEPSALAPGGFIEVEITGAAEYDLWAKAV